MTGLSYVKLHHDSRSDLQAEASQLRAESPGDIGVEAWKKVLQPGKMVGFIFFLRMEPSNIWNLLWFHGT